MKRAILYARVSSREQADKDLSTLSQFPQMQKYCQEHGWEIVKEIADEGISGTRVDRKGLQEIMAMATNESCHFDIVLVWKLSRFARNLRLRLHLWLALSAHTRRHESTGLPKKFLHRPHILKCE